MPELVSCMLQSMKITTKACCFCVVAGEVLEAFKPAKV